VNGLVAAGPVQDGRSPAVLRFPGFYIVEDWRNDASAGIERCPAIGMDGKCVAASVLDTVYRTPALAAIRIYVVVHLAGANRGDLVPAIPLRAGWFVTRVARQVPCGCL
jgi:hypothetical protein